MIYNCCCLVFCKFSLRMLRLRCHRLCQQRRLVRRCVWGNNNNNHFSKQKNKGPVTHSACLPQPACWPGPASASASTSTSASAPLCILLLFRNGDDAICVCFSVILHSEQCTVKRGRWLTEGCRQISLSLQGLPHCQLYAMFSRLASFTPVVICAHSQQLLQAGRVAS